MCECLHLFILLLAEAGLSRRHLAKLAQIATVAVQFGAVQAKKQKEISHLQKCRTRII